VKDNIFKIVNKKTGNTVDPLTYAQEHKLSLNISINDIEGFAVGSDREIYILDENGKWGYVYDEDIEVVVADKNTGEVRE